MSGTDANLPASLASVLLSAGKNMWVIIGAFAGSIIFIISETEYTHWAKLGLFTASIIIGISSSELMASLIEYCFLRYLDFKIIVPNSVGATVSAVISVRILMYVNHQKNDENSILTQIIRGQKK